MIELQLISRILHDKSLNILAKNGIEPDDFMVEKSKINFIVDFYKQWKHIPSPATFIEKFPDFIMLESENEDYIVYKFKETQLYNKVVPVIQEMANMAREDSFEAIEFIKEEIRKLIRETSIGGQGYDIISGAGERLEEWERRKKVEGLMGISTGIPQLDEILHGWLPGEDLTIIFGRTNEGKSWVLLFFLVVAWKLGNTVVLYSGEMSKHLVGFRFDSLNEHFSNLGLMCGKEEGLEDYPEYIAELRDKHRFIVVTPTDLGGRRATVSDIRRMAEEYDADIVGIDQITLMEDERRGENKRIQFTNIAEDLFALSEDMKIPVLAVTQANREVVKRQGATSPELHEIGESDGIAQYASRVISIKVVDNVLRLSIRKNRYGLNNMDILMLWDIDRGNITPVIEGESYTRDDYGF
jgi:replicative DNA helicase